MPSWGSVPKEIRERVKPPPSRRSFESSDEYEDALSYWRGSVGRVLGLAMQRHRETPRRLLYRVVPHNGGVVFADPERAEYIAAIHKAIDTSETWGQFGSQMPPVEFEELLASAFDDQGEARPEDSEQFSGEALPGWVDGDYPAWLQKEQGEVLPQIILETFAKRTPTSLNGSYWHIPEESVGDVCKALRALGFSVECRQDLPFR